VAARLSAIYTFAAALAGCAGALLAQTTGFVSLDVFDFQRSADVVLMLVIGAAGWLYGGLLGAIIFKVLHLVLSGLSPQYWIFWVGLFLVLLVLIGRERLLRPWTIARTRLTSAFAGSRRRPASTLMSRTSEEKS
jgi:branched-chain amino acid transport system permease protein